jgi:hypothetical protein
MARKYQTFGPFEIPRTNDLNAVEDDRMSEFWAEIESEHPGLTTAAGCYVFGISASRGLRPWYVGKANGNSGFRQEACNHRNLRNYEKVLRAQGRGRPVLFLIARLKPVREGFANSPPESEILWIEKSLIAFGAEANKSLINKHGRRYLAECHIPGLLNSDGRARLDEPTEKLLRLFNIDSKKRRRRQQVDNPIEVDGIEIDLTEIEASDSPDTREIDDVSEADLSAQPEEQLEDNNNTWLWSGFAIVLASAAAATAAYFLGYLPL